MKTLEEIAFIVYLMEMTFDYDLNLEDIDREFVTRYLRKWKDIYIPSLQIKHSGDCTNECHTCMRCLTEVFFKVAEMIEEVLK